jgi:hypothetical protein
MMAALNNGNCSYYTMDLNLDSPRPKSGRGYQNMNSEDNRHECLFHLP